MVLLDVAHISDDMLQLPVSVCSILCSLRWLLLALLLSHVLSADVTTKQQLRLCHELILCQICAVGLFL